MASICQTSLFFSFSSYSISLPSWAFSQHTLHTCQLTTLLSLMTSSQTTESARERPIHPFETFRPSMDDQEYALFESKIIRPSIRAAQSRAILLDNSILTHLPISFKPGHPSLEDTQRFLLETDYNCPSHKLHLPLPVPAAKMSSRIPLNRILIVKGYFSKKQPDCFVWKEGLFEEGSRVIFGNSGRLGQVLRVCGVGKNYFMLRIKDMERTLENEVAI